LRISFVVLSVPSCKCQNIILGYVSHFSGVVVSVLATGPKGCRFKPGQGDGFLRVIKICSTPSSGEEIRLETPGCKILWHVKITCKYEQKYFARPNCNPSCPFLLLATR
jgi:hypothetical protein